jgi:hypothetical protein
VALKKAVRRFTATDTDLDRERLVEFCNAHAFTAISDIIPRTHVNVGGEVRSVRLVPRAGAPSLEVAITDGRGTATAVFLGRHRITGIVPGRHIAVEGVAGKSGGRLLVFNPVYTLYP